MVWRLFLTIAPDRQFRVRSPPKLAFSPQVLVIIADLCNATVSGVCRIVTNSAPQRSESESARHSRAERVRYRIVAGHRDPPGRACTVAGPRTDRRAEQRRARIDSEDS